MPPTEAILRAARLVALAAVALALVGGGLWLLTRPAPLEGACQEAGDWNVAETAVCAETEEGGASASGMAQ